MAGRFERHLATAVAVGVFVVVAVVGATTLGVVGAGALVVSSVVDKRSLSWVFLVAALLVTVPAVAALAAIALPSSWPEHDLWHGSMAALRRGVAAAFNPILVLGAALGAFRGGASRELWWMIGWLPALLTAALGFVLWFSLPTLGLTVVLIFAGAFLSLGSIRPDTNMAFRSTATGFQDLASVSSAAEITRAEAEVDWSKVVEASEVFTGRPPKQAVETPDDLATLQPEPSEQLTEFDPGSAPSQRTV